MKKGAYKMKEELDKLTDITVDGRVIAHNAGVLTLTAVIPNVFNDPFAGLSSQDDIFYNVKAEIADNNLITINQKEGLSGFSGIGNTVLQDVPIWWGRKNDVPQGKKYDHPSLKNGSTTSNHSPHYTPLSISTTLSEKVVNEGIRYLFDKDKYSLLYLSSLEYPYISREQWGANSVNENVEIEKIDNPSAYYNTIVIHHTYKSQMQPIKDLQKYFQDKGDADIGYHYIISGDGTIYEGRPINIKGAHVYQNNTGKIGIALMGNFQDESGLENYKDALKWVEGAPPTEPTNAQIRSLKQLLKMLKSQFTIEKVGGHRDFAVQGGETVCPGNTLYRIFENEGIIML